VRNTGPTADCIPNTLYRADTCEANRYSATQEISQHLWDLIVHYHIHNSMPFIPILRQMNPTYTSPTYFYIIHFSTILPTIPQVFPLKMCGYIPPHLIFTDLIILKPVDEEYLLFQFSPTSRLFLLLRFK
jgi:hypothetical protein